MSSMRHIKPYQLFEASAAAPQALTQEQISWLNKCTRGSWKLNSSTGLIDIEGHFNCNSQSLKELNGVKFGKVSGHFACSNNQLTSLVGAPKTVNGGFSCRENPVSEETLESIFRLMKRGKSYQQALEEYWPKMGDEDRTLMYKDHSSLTPEETRKYKALATYGNIKGYL